MPRLTARKNKNIDLRHFDAGGRFVCTAEHPWSGKREDAPKGVRHVDTTEEARDCPNCGTKW